MYPCKNCQLSFANQTALKNHARCFHQKSKVISFNGNSMSIERSSDGFFWCLKCSKSSCDPRFVSSHAKCFFEDATQTSADSDDVLVADVSNSNPSELTNVLSFLPEVSGSFEGEISTCNLSLESVDLALYNLHYETSRKIFICTLCPCTLHLNIAKHLKRHHGITMSVAVESKLLETFDIEEFIPDCTVKASPLPFLPIVDGFQCNDCFYCCCIKKNMA